MNCDLKFIHGVRDRYGRRRYYFRRKGWPSVALPGAPGEPEFVAAWQAAMECRTPRVAPSGAPIAGSFKALARAYESSAEFGQLAPLTRREMGYVIRAWVAAHGDKPVALLERRHILQERDSLKDKPGAANKMIRTLKTLLRFAVDRGYRDDNPGQGIKMLRLGEWRPWTALEMAAFEARWPLGTLERTGYALALYTGQRRADLAQITWRAVAGNALRLRQGKTGATLEIPIHPRLQEALAAVHPRVEAAILTGAAAGALNPIYFGHLMARAIDAAGLPKECVLHGLRKSAAVALIEAGCSPHEAAAITGHKTARMIEHYAKARDQVHLGKAAMLKWQGK